jgi:D-xylose transport system permease protein
MKFNLKQLFTQYKMLALLIAVALIWAFFSYHTEGASSRRATCPT